MKYFGILNIFKGHNSQKGEWQPSEN
jgi:hypothetical protein